MRPDQSPALGGSRRQKNPRLLRQLSDQSDKKRNKAVEQVKQQGTTADYVSWLLDEIPTWSPLQRANAMESVSRLRDPRLTPDKIFPEMLPVPVGEVVLGSERHPDERPVNRVHVPPFKLARYPVTVFQYQRFVEDSGHAPPMYWTGGVPPAHQLNTPVVWVTARDAEAYCRWLSSKKEAAYRLPTEPEWVLAGRGSRSNQLYPWGNAFKEKRANAWSRMAIEKLCAVGLFPEGAGPYGHEDLSGNVWEWTASKFWRYPYQPNDGREDLSNDKDKRLILGGSWRSRPFSVTLTTREGNRSTDRFEIVGFRVVSAL